MRSGLALGAALLAVVTSAGCGENTFATPTGPTTTTGTPFVTQFGGLYTGTVTLTSVNGGECVADLYLADIAAGAVDVGTVTLNQTGSDVDAIVRSASTGLTCTYDGNTALGTFSLGSTACDVQTILVGCPTGEARVLKLVRSTMTGTSSGRTVQGVIASYYNVFADIDGETAERPITGMILQYDFSGQR